VPKKDINKGILFRSAEGRRAATRSDIEAEPWRSNSSNQFGSPALLSGFLFSGNQWSGQLLVQREQVLHALPVVLERLRAVAEINSTVEFRMGYSPALRHRFSRLQPRRGARK